MKVVGITTQQEVYIGSKDRNFRINEFLIIMDEAQGDLMGEVVEANTYNRYIPLNINGDLVDSSVLESLRAIGYNIDEDTIYIAKVRLINEAQYPVETGSDVRVPKFYEVKDFMVKANKEEGLVLGLIRNTDQMEEDMDEELKNILYTFEDDKLKPQKGIPYILDLKSMHQYPHIGVFGGSGSGKSFGLRVVLEELMKLNIPTIVLDPHFEMDFSEMQEYLPDDEKEDFSGKFKCLQVGYDVGVKFEDLSPQDLKNLLDASSTLTDAMNNVVDILYKRKDSYQSFHDRLKMLSEAQEEGSQEKIKRRIEEATTTAETEAWKKRKELYDSYDKTCPYSSVKGIFWRLRKLYNEGIFSNDIHEIEEGLKLGKLIVVQGSTRMLQVFSTYLLNNLYHKRRDFKDALYKHTTSDYFPPFFIVTDESHNFAPKGYECPSKAVLKEISQEGRKYGVFLILATQRPTLLEETITAQLNTKFIFRTVRSSDIQTIREETDIKEEEARRLPYLKSGDVFISSATMGRTIYVRIRASKTRSPHTLNPFDELKKYSKEEEEKFYRIIKDKLPINESQFLSILGEVEKEYGEAINMDQLKEKMEKLVESEKIEKVATPFGDMYK
ncbi:ATP-binding protein [Sporanaerobacter acetigenes]|uniref:ATP-binding protein n=1 Tax=Sporanaerobacter acetigenes TaxID=165813 RepID=UPI00104DE693|nr:ATP-binding protein [Sporanaerobacter acetigenes]